MNCKSCHTEHLPGQKFCANCGAALSHDCRECGYSLEKDDKFCRKCGAFQSSDQLELSAETDRRPITAFFSDLVGSTDLSTVLDPEDLRDIMLGYQKRSSQVITRYGGYISRFMGDGILVYFGYPTAQEDAAERAIRAALDIVSEISNLETVNDRQLEVRIGIATGVVIAGDQIGDGSAEERTVVGETPNLAARLQSLAKPNQVVVADSTFRLIKGLFTATDLGHVELKGFPNPRRCWRIENANDEENRFEMTHAESLTRLIGRDDEFQLLMQRLETSKNGKGQVVQISGDGGIGKSRIIQEVLTQTASENYHVVTFSCSPIHSNAALYPIIQFIRRWLDATENVDGRLESLETNLDRLGLNSPESMQLLASLLSIELPPGRYSELELTPQSKRQKTHKILSDCISAEAEINPVICIWDDLHWSDPSTLEVLSQIIEKTENSRQLHLLSFRPEFDPPWENQPNITTLELQPLNEEQTGKLIKELSESAGLPANVVDSLVSRSDGVPLFAEELAQMAIESSQIEDSPLKTMEIPSSIHDSLVSRLDRLGFARKIAQITSVIGRNFTSELLNHIIDEQDTVIEAGLARLVETKILVQQGSSTKASYQFRHALIQDAAYRSLLNKSRRNIHLQIADAFENHFAETAEQEPEVLAYHLTEAKTADRATVYWQRAGEQASLRFDNVEAVNYFQKALDMIKDLDSYSMRVQMELGLLLSIGVPLTIIRGFASEEVGNVYGRAKDISLTMETNAALHLILNGLYRYYFVRGDVLAAHDIAEKLMTLAEEADDNGHRVFANQAISFTFSMLGRIAEAKEHLDNVDKFYNREEHLKLVEMYGADALIAARTNGAVAVLFVQGKFDLASKWMKEAEMLARHQGNPNELAWALTYAGVAAQQFGDIKDTLEKAEECIEISTRYEMHFWLAGGEILRGWSHWRDGQTELGLTEMREGIKAWRQTGAGIFLSYFQSLLLGALVEEGLVEEGFEVLTETDDHIQKSQELWWTAEIERLRGELMALKTPDDHQSVLGVLHHSIEIAVTQDVPALELRGRMSLVNHDPSGANIDKLTECLTGFSQNSPTTDLIRAHELVKQPV